MNRKIKEPIVPRKHLKITTTEDKACQLISTFQKKYSREGTDPVIRDI